MSRSQIIKYLDNNGFKIHETMYRINDVVVILFDNWCELVGNNGKDTYFYNWFENGLERAIEVVRK